jgi:nicotinate-nucleotide pyrophosphorylase (carboxylating)
MDLIGREVQAWLEEDVGDGDLTSVCVIDEDALADAVLVLKEAGVICGLTAAATVYAKLGGKLVPLVQECALTKPGHVARVHGRARAVLTGERLALNLVARLSGVATLTRRYVDAVAGTGVEILDTRKTTPGLRTLEKHAVRCGGGTSHRFGLFDAVLIKDNHLRLIGSIRAAVERARIAGVAIQVECDTLDHVREALDAGAEAILLDNMSTAQLREAVALVAGRARLEASGGITLENVRAVAETGVNVISVGALTHSSRSLDVSLEVL